MRRLVAVAAAPLVAVVLGGCMLEIGAGNSGIVNQLWGTVIGTPISGSLVVTASANTGSVCPATDTTILDVGISNNQGGIYKTECPTSSTSGTNFIAVKGTYTIRGGTGAYTGATGTGTFTFSMGLGVAWFTTTEFGTFTVPSMASAASAGAKRTFRSRETVKTLTVRNGHGRRYTIKHPDLSRLLALLERNR